ncbi:MAG TPA: aromatic amino acid lyase, partial [Gemmatimonadales bacterium]|nr:aromatic amino acid lyase [Gemmatimonadales bacterium]
MTPSTIPIDGHSLSLGALVQVARDRGTRVVCDPGGLDRLAASRKAVESALARGETIYGINTGFGKL